MISRKSSNQSNYSQKMINQSQQYDLSDGSQNCISNNRINFMSDDYEAWLPKENFNSEEQDQANITDPNIYSDKTLEEWAQENDQQIEKSHKTQEKKRFYRSLSGQTQVENKILNQRQTKNILQKKALQQFMGKNINMPKFIVRLFIKYLNLYQTQFLISKLSSYYNKLNKYCIKLKSWTKKSKKNTFNLSHVNKVLNFDYHCDNPQIQKQGSMLCRKLWQKSLVNSCSNRLSAMNK